MTEADKEPASTLSGFCVRALKLPCQETPPKRGVDGRWTPKISPKNFS